MDSLKGMMTDIHVFLYGGMTVLPLAIGGTMLIIGLFTANYAMLFFLIGFLILSPFVATMFDYGFRAVLPDTWIKVLASDICKVNIPFTTLQNPLGRGSTENVVCSPWLAMITFFLGYILHNSIQLYKRPTLDPSLTVNTTKKTDEKVSNRTSQALLSLISIVVISLVILGFRYKTGCENPIGMLITTSIFMVGGYYWYDLLSQIGQDRLADLFGIANRLLAPSAIRNGPVACIPDPSAPCDATE